MSGASPDRRRPVPRWVAVAALAAALLVNEPVLERTAVPDGEIGSTLLRVAILGFDLLAVAFAAWILARRPRSRVPWNRLGLAAAGALCAWFLAFAVLDTRAPELLGGTGIPYFELRSRFRPDSSLVMVRRRLQREETYLFRGDLHVPDDDLPDPAVPYEATYNAWGFRTNGGDPPYRIAVIGDSFVEIGESDGATISERIRGATGLSTFNLGRGWYGPHQYAVLLERYALELDPELAICFFFEGNDAEDALEYERWREGGGYRQFTRAQGSLPERFVAASLDLLSFAQWEGARRIGLRRAMAEALGRDEPLAIRNTGLVTVGGERVPMKFGYWPETTGASAADLLESARWRAVRRAFERFRDTAEAHGVTPLLVFVPTKASVYAGRIAEVPGRFRDRGAPAGDAPPVQAEALAALAEELGVAELDLTPRLRAAAAERPLLYYPQDTHWTPAARRIAARAVASFLRERWPETLSGEGPRSGPSPGAPGTSGGRRPDGPR